MAFDERDYMKENHQRANEKNLDIYYNPKEFRRETPNQQPNQYDEIRGFVPYTSEQKFAIVLICMAVAWIGFAVWKILHA